jgi:hypothetical protein
MVSENLTSASKATYLDPRFETPDVDSLWPLAEILGQLR